MGKVTPLTDEERIEANKAKGYLLVENIDGLEVYKKQNEAGGWTYYGESCGIFSPIWDDCTGTKKELIAIAKDCYNLKIE